MRIDWDVPVRISDGTVLRADVFRPERGAGPWPVLLSHGPYAKGLAFDDGYPDQWRLLTEAHPEVAEGTSNRYQSWEVVDPEKWLPHGYVCVRVDSRGAGRSPGFLDCWSPREIDDLYECIEWAGTQPWSSGKVGLSGISYYAINQWQVAGRQPPHLAAICGWEGAADYYRDISYHGGILSTFVPNWFRAQVESVQHGVGERGARSAVTGELVTGPETLDPDELRRNRADMGDDIRVHPFDDEFHRSRSADWERVVVPMLSCANWGGQGLHARGNFEAFLRAASEQKWLECHGLEHWTHYYTDYGRELQRRFFDHFLKGENNGWDAEPRVLLQVRYPGDRFVERAEHEWPLARTRWTHLYLDAASGSLASEPPTGPSQATYRGLGEGLTFSTPPLDEETEITGPLSLSVTVSSSTSDADVFAILRVIDADGGDVTFQGTLDPHTPPAQGWLRASRRKLDPALSLPYRPYHSHDEKQPLEPGVPVGLDVELWPTCVVVPAGYRLALTIQGRDWEYGGAPVEVAWFRMRGCGPFLHDDPRDRPPEIFDGEVTVHTGGERPAALLVPVIPSA